MDPDPQIAQTLQASLAKAGITVELQQVPQDDLYGQYLVQPSDAQRGVRDLAVVDWGPTWFGNNGRTRPRSSRTSPGLLPRRCRA